MQRAATEVTLKETPELLVAHSRRLGEVAQSPTVAQIARYPFEHPSEPRVQLVSTEDAQNQHLQQV